MNSLALSLATPAALIAGPAAVLIFLTRPTPGHRVVAAACAGLTVWWLLGVGDLPDQVVRAAALLATAGFGLLSRRTTWTVTHRALAAVAVAAVGIALAFLLFGWSWDRLQWWLEFRTGATLRLLLSRMAVATPGDAGPVGAAGPAEFEESLDSLVRTSAELFPAALALQLLLSLVLAAWGARRLTGVSVGRPLGRFAEFTFSEHLGWVLAVAIVALLVPGLGGARPVAFNLLVVLGTLYFARGAAVLLFGIRAVGGGPLLYVGAGLALFFLLPGIILLGVIDAGLNLRRRRAPRTGA